ncbi:MAG: response regulator transcription factor [Chloroflexi bacterium]|nr:response regulator transcription factor [Chloroflexota bacterium]
MLSTTAMRGHAGQGQRLARPIVGEAKGYAQVTDTIPLYYSHLTLREREVLEMVAEGCSNKLIGHHLCISERTVKNHLANIRVKLRALDRTHAVVTALRLGWLSLGPNS